MIDYSINETHFNHTMHELFEILSLNLHDFGLFNFF